MAQPASQQSMSATDAAKNTLKSLFSGAIAGAISRTATSPLERLKVMKQMQTTGDKYSGVFTALRSMWREEGPLSYWKGNGTNVARIAPYSAIQFFAFDNYKRMLVGDANPTSSSSGSAVATHTLLVLTAGAMSGMTSSVICYPLDLVRSFLTVQTSVKHYDGMVDCLKAIYRKDGFFGLYRGLGATLGGIAPYVAINFTVFDTLKRYFLPDRSSPYFDVANLGLGACAGAVAAGITYPTDVVRRRMQLQGMAAANLPKYDNTWHCIKTIYRTETFRGFYKGLVPCFLKVIPSVAISFSVYERLRVWLKFVPVKAVSAGG